MADMIALTDKQIKLARHALGFDQGVKQSYRNRFTVSKGSETWADWQNLVDQGMAEKHQWDGTMSLFTLTRAGADSVLEDGETLCPEDFPQQPNTGE